MAVQKLRPLPPDAPHVGDGEPLQAFAALRLAVDEPNPVRSWGALGKAVRGLGECLGRADAHRYRNAGLAADRAANFLRISFEPGGVESGEIQKRFVDAVNLYLGREALQHLHHAVAHVAVERVIGRKHRDVVALDLGPLLKVRVAHLEAERLGLVAPGDHAAVIVGKHDDGPSAQARSEHPFARRIEVIAIDQGEHDEAPLPASRSETCR